MRVIAGELGGQIFEAPSGHRTHPMSDKVRGAIFNILGDISGLTLLDAFAGSGAISLEAVSRGAKHAVAIDIDKSAHKTIVANSLKLKTTDKIKAIRANASGWSDNNPEKRFDIVICDPPFDGLQLTILQKLTQHAKSGGLYVLNWPGKLEVPELTGMFIVQKKVYGDSQLVFYQLIS